jgi:glycosyltransferase involved in cell wall biosynthesis
LPAVKRAVRVTALAASAQLGGTERVLLDFAARAFEHDLVLRVLTPRDGPLIGILNEIGVPADVVPASRRMLAGSQRLGGLWSLPGSLAGLVAWAGRLARHQHFRDADVIYSVAFKTHLANAWLRRHPAVWHLHEYPPAVTGPAWRLLSRFVPDAMIANSDATAAAWSGTPPTAHRPRRTAHVIPNGVDLDRFHPRPRTHWIHDRLGIPHDRRIIGMPAVFARWKGQLEVIRAFSAVASQFPDVHLVFLGGSIYDTVAERQYGFDLQRAVNGVNVHLLPFKAKIELAYPEFDLTLHYSLRPEPFGRVVLESLASGVPVIAAGEGGPVEILGDAQPDGLRTTDNAQRLTNGWLVTPRDVAALSRTLRGALSLPANQLRALGDAARRRAEDHFSARQFAKQVAEVLRGAALQRDPAWRRESGGG